MKLQTQTLQSYLSEMSRSFSEAPAKEGQDFWGEDGFDFADILDIANPLQHLPFISKWYRNVSQDDISEGSRLLGSLLFGGITGGVAGVVTATANSLVRQETRQDISDHLWRLTDRYPVSTFNQPKTAESSRFIHPFLTQRLEMEKTRFKPVSVNNQAMAYHKHQTERLFIHYGQA